MNCSGSPTTCTAAEPSARERATRELAAALVFRAVLAPLAAGLGPVGETVCADLAERLAARRR